MTQLRSIRTLGARSTHLSRRGWFGLALGGVLVVAGCGSDSSSNEFEPTEDEPDNPLPDSDQNESELDLPDE